MVQLVHLERNGGLGVDGEVPQQGEGHGVDENHLPSRGRVESTYKALYVNVFCVELPKEKTTFEVVFAFAL